MSEVCPISFKQVDEKAARINALLSAISVALFIVTSYKLLIAFLAIDFFIRGFIDPLYSFYTGLSKSLLRITNNKPKLIDGSPKIFAAKLGFIMSSLILVFAVLNFQAISIILSTMLILFASLEGIFSYCVGCKIYSYIEKLKKNQS
ncbi:MAG: DUF4395 domain-containing protein [Bacteroidetes bacterium]|nr:DUF4395 domain-containing protein [Bacteroidota bacterium]MBU1114031.1 DUF4395 domain-containing protein [Bacteroidota bacterium]MBU1798953.1 DUF4395 domain-containing protein [Bacteroidota bacterium]